MHRIRRTGPALFLASALLFAACSSSSAKPASKNTTGADSSTASYSPPRCRQQRPAAPQVTPVAGSAHDFTLTSFDDAQIRFHWYPLDHRAPTVLMGPGWGQAGATEQSGTGLFGDSPINNLQANGYHVLTWDPRGFGKSTGTITVDSADAEARDVQRLLDWLATQPNVQLDGATDPRVGMVGGSYGGGIQIVTAAIDCRVDTIVPTIAWHSLTTSLDKADTAKTGWSGILYTAAAGRQRDPHITSSYNAGTQTGLISAEDRAWFASRGPGALVARVKIPTLFIQGTVDTLFTLDEAVTNYRILRDHGVPTAMLWYCGGHGVCLTDPGDAKRSEQATKAWLQRWLQRDTSVRTGPRIDIVDQHGTRFTAPDDPIALGQPLAADGSGTLSLMATGGSGPAKVPAGNKDPIGGIAAGIAPARATNAVNVTFHGGSAASTSVGAPKLELTYSGTTPPGERPTRVFAQLVDDATGPVLGNQVTPIVVQLDGRSHKVSVPLEIVCHTLAPGGSVTLQLVATTVAYAAPRFGGTIDFRSIHIELPIAKGLTRVG